MCSWLLCKERFSPLAQGSGGFEDDEWDEFLEEREWMADFCYKREGEDCPRGSRGASVLDFETPSYHIVSLAKEGLDQVLESIPDLEDTQRTALRSNVAICNVDGSIDDECAPLTMTIKARIYALGTPRSVEVRHEYHKRQGWDLPEYSQAVSWRLNQPEECGRRFMPIYKRDEEGWRTMFYSYLDFCKAPNAGSTGGSHGVARAMRGRKRGGRGRGRGSARGLSRSLAASRENSLAGSGDSDGNVTDDFGGTQQEGGGATVGSGAGAGAQHRLSSMASAAATMAEGGAEAEGAGEAGMSVCMAPDGAQYESLEGAQAGGRHGDAAHSNTTSPNASQRAGGGPARSCSHVGGEGGGTGHENESVAVMHNGLLQNGGGAAASAAEEAVGASQQQQQQQQRPSTIIRQKWLMSSEDLQLLYEHLLAGSELEDELAQGDVLDLVLASVGIVNGKVGGVEVGKPMYGRSFLEHHKRRLCGSGGARPAVAASQVASEVSDEEYGAAREQARVRERAVMAAAKEAAAAEGAKRELVRGGIGGPSSRRRKRQRASASAPPSGANSMQLPRPLSPQSTQQQEAQQQEQAQSQPEQPQQAQQRPKLPPLQVSTPPLQQQQQQQLQQGLLSMPQHSFPPHPQLLQHPQLASYIQQQQVLQYLAHQQMLHAYALHQQHHQQQQEGQQLQQPQHVGASAYSLPRSVFTQGPVAVSEQNSPTSIFSHQQWGYPAALQQHGHNNLPYNMAGRSSAPPALPVLDSRAGPPSAAEGGSSSSQPHAANTTGPHMLGPTSSSALPATSTSSVLTQPIGRPPLAVPARRAAARGVNNNTGSGSINTEGQKGAGATAAPTGAASSSAAAAAPPPATGVPCAPPLSLSGPLPFQGFPSQLQVPGVSGALWAQLMGSGGGGAASALSGGSVGASGGSGAAVAAAAASAGASKALPLVPGAPQSVAAGRRASHS